MERKPRTVAAAMAGDDARPGCQVVAVGDHGTGKSSLIIALATDSFPEKPPPVLPPTRLPPDFYPDRVPLTIIDTSSRYAMECNLLPCFYQPFLTWVNSNRHFSRYCREWYELSCFCKPFLT